MKRILCLTFLAGTLTIMGCSSDKNKDTQDSTDIAMPDTSTSSFGADTTSAATDSLRDSLNR